MDLHVASSKGSPSSSLLALGRGQVMPSTLLTGAARPSDIFTIVVLQGIGTGLVSTMSYAIAVQALASSLASVGGAASPVVTAVLAVPLFSEEVNLGLAAALFLIVAGVVALTSPRSSPCDKGERPLLPTRLPRKP
jgi:drug/metabolite transporter (DMT)-like permease